MSLLYPGNTKGTVVGSLGDLSRGVTHFVVCVQVEKSDCYEMNRFQGLVWNQGDHLGGDSYGSNE